MAQAPAAFLLLKLGDDITNEYFIVSEKDTYDWDKTTWVHTPITKYASYAMLDSLCTTDVKLTTTPTNDGYQVQVSNPTDKVAFMIRLTAKNQGELICPAYWSDNYLTLAPGETRTVTCRMPSLTDKTKVEIGVFKQ